MKPAPKTRGERVSFLVEFGPKFPGMLFAHRFAATNYMDVNFPLGTYTVRTVLVTDAPTRKREIR